MKYSILFISTLLVFISCKKEEIKPKTTTTIVTEIASNCTDSTNQLKALFLPKAQQLAVRFALEENTNWKDSSQISQDFVNDILKGFYAIQQANQLKNKDLSLKIAIYPYPSLNTITLFLDKNSALANSWNKDYTTTPSDTINDLLKKFDLKVIAYDVNHSKGHKVVLNTTNVYNTEAILSQFLKISGVITGNNEENTAIVNDIKYTKKEGIKTLQFIDRTGSKEVIYSYQIDENCMVKVL